VTAGLRRSHVRLSAVQSQPESVVLCADDIKIARQRMRHLVPWHVEPVPAMHSAAGRPTEPLSKSAREPSRRLALQVLAIHMWHAAARSALR